MAILFLTSIPWNAIFASMTGLFLVIYLALVAKSHRRLRHFSGPWPARFTDLWYAKLVMSGSMDTGTAALFEKYGSLVRIGPNALVTKDTDMIRKMNATRSPYRRAASYKAFKFNAASDNMLSTIDEERHTYLRNRMTPGYAGKGNPNLEQQINNRIQDLVDLIDRKYKSIASDLRPLDLARIAAYFTLDTLSDIAFDRPLGYLTSDSDPYQYIQAVEQSTAFAMTLSALPPLQKLFELAFVRRMFGPSPKDSKGFGKIMGIAKEVIAERFGSDKKVKHDMIGSFIDNGLTQEECESQSLLQIIAGSDTTATALRVTMFHIISLPHVYNALRAEIDVASENNLLSSPMASDLDARELPYLQACIREGLRICPPATSLLDRVVPAEGDSFGGKSIPGGTRIGLNFYAVLRSKEVFGADADFYRPERWLEAEGEDKYRMEKTQELAFSAGRFMCMGKSIALMELNKCILEMIRRYDWTRIGPNKAFRSICYGLHFQSGMWVRISDRAKHRSN